MTRGRLLILRLLGIDMEIRQVETPEICNQNSSPLFSYDDCRVESKVRHVT